MQRNGSHHGMIRSDVFIGYKTSSMTLAQYSSTFPNFTCSFKPNRPHSANWPPSKPLKIPTTPITDRVLDFGKYKGKMLGTLPSTYLKWVSKNLRAGDFEHWAKLADQVLQDPVYKDRVEWEFADAVLKGTNSKNSNAISGSSSSFLSRNDEDDSAVSRLLEISERFGWDNEDKAGWGRVNFELLGTTKGGKIPRRSSSSSGGVKEEKGFSRLEDGENNHKVLSESEDRRRERRERAKLKKQVGVRKDKIGIVMKSKDGFVNGVDGDGGIRLEGSKPGSVDHQDWKVENNSPFPGRESLLNKLPDHLLIEIFVRVPISEWAQISCVKRQWANVFRGECLWQAALSRTYPLAHQTKRWPGPIPRGLSRRQKQFHEYTLLTADDFVLADQFIACGKSRDTAHELASQIWLAVLDNLEDNEHTFLLLKRLALEGDVSCNSENSVNLPYKQTVSFTFQILETIAYTHVCACGVAVLV
ncbi:unnamed protein product [Dovyalis caffra]|uniref:F-box domain-containing protein n=1 Tax=Dovyalis caffra TaxID=77055 RepID=A0AAV1QRX6_9ROSI|nr:unnamed protein product [Dovyalis caffra]